MSIQFLDPSLNRTSGSTNKPQNPRPSQDLISNDSGLGNIQNTTIKPLRTLLSNELQTTLQTFSDNAKSSAKQSPHNPLQQYQKVSDFVQIDQLSNIIGIDIKI